MKALVIFLCLSLSPAAAQVVSLGDTDRDAYRLIRGQEEWARLHQQRDPDHLAKLATIPESFSFVQDGKTKSAKQLARDYLGTYYDSFELSDFRVQFTSSDEVVLTYRAVVAMHGFGKKGVASSYVKKIVKKIDGQWTGVSTVLTPAK